MSAGMTGEAGRGGSRGEGARPTPGAVSVIIVNWNGARLLGECLDSLRAQTRQPDEVLVIDNGSEDGSQALLRERYPEVTLVEMGRNTGFSVANNVGLRRARGEYIALLNNDVLLDAAWMERMAGALAADAALGSCACKMLFYDRRDTLDSAGITMGADGNSVNRGINQRDGATYAESARVFGACAGAALYRAALFADIGLFDEDLYIYYEDVDLSFRAQLAGYDCLYVPQAIAFHHHSASGGRLGKKHYYLTRNNLIVTLKNMPTPLLRRSLPRILGHQLQQALFLGLRGQAGTYTQAHRDVLRMLPGTLRKRRAIQRCAHRTSTEIDARFT